MAIPWIQDTEIWEQVSCCKVILGLVRGPGPSFARESKVNALGQCSGFSFPSLQRTAKFQARAVKVLLLLIFSLPSREKRFFQLWLGLARRLCYDFSCFYCRAVSDLVAKDALTARLSCRTMLPQHAFGSTRCCEPPDAICSIEDWGFMNRQGQKAQPTVTQLEGSACIGYTTVATIDSTLLVEISLGVEAAAAAAAAAVMTSSQHSPKERGYRQKLLTQKISEPLLPKSQRSKSSKQHSRFDVRITPAQAGCPGSIKQAETPHKMHFFGTLEPSHGRLLLLEPFP